MKPPKILPSPTALPAMAQRPVMIGDLFEIIGRQRTVWNVSKLLEGRNLPARAELRQLDGVGRVTVNVDDLLTEVLFKRIGEASVNER